MRFCLFVCFCLFKVNLTSSLQAAGIGSCEKSMNNFEVLHGQSWGGSRTLSRTHPYSVTCSRQTFLISIPCSLPQNTPNKLSELSFTTFLSSPKHSEFFFCSSFLVKPALLLKEAELRLVTRVYGVAQKLEEDQCWWRWRYWHSDPWEMEEINKCQVLGFLKK